MLTLELESNKHSVFKLNYHLVLGIKYRRKAISDEVTIRLKEIFEYISPKYKIVLEEHVHLLFRANPNIEIPKCL